MMGDKKELLINLCFQAQNTLDFLQKYFTTKIWILQVFFIAITLIYFANTVRFQYFFFCSGIKPHKQAVSCSNNSFSLWFNEHINSRLKLSRSLLVVPASIDISSLFLWYPSICA